MSKRNTKELSTEDKISVLSDVLFILNRPDLYIHPFLCTLLPLVLKKKGLVHKNLIISDPFEYIPELRKWHTILGIKTHKYDKRQIWFSNNSERIEWVEKTLSSLIKK